MLAAHQAMRSSGEYKSTWQSLRAALPAYSMADKIVGAIKGSQAVVISGAPGCGKTTQVPQFLLDHFIESGHAQACNIVCTQPRRISAVAVAERVAAERCQRVGGCVGYQIRLERRISAATRLTFCTTGVCQLLLSAAVVVADSCGGVAGVC